MNSYQFIGKNPNLCEVTFAQVHFLREKSVGHCLQFLSFICHKVMNEIWSSVVSYKVDVTKYLLTLQSMSSVTGLNMK